MTQSALIYPASGNGLTSSIAIWMISCLMCHDKYAHGQKNVSDDAVKQNILDMHNKIRTRVTPSASNMKKMYWSPDIASRAQGWAEYCSPRHSEGSRTRLFPGDKWMIGENLLTVSGGASNWSQAVDGWATESIAYTFAQKQDVPGTMTGHYTQEVWAESYLLGCGWSPCDGTGEMGLTALYVCQYYPGGNHNARNGDFEAPYLAGPPCTQCADGWPSCTPDGKLCDGNKDVPVRDFRNLPTLKVTPENSAPEVWPTTSTTSNSTSADSSGVRRTKGGPYGLVDAGLLLLPFICLSAAPIGSNVFV